MSLISEFEVPLTGGLSRSNPAASGAPASDCTVRRLDHAVWDEQFSEYRDIVHEQTACFNLARWPADALQFLAVERQNRIVGGAVVRTVKAPANLARLSILRWGPLWRPAHREPDPANLSRILNALTEELVVRQNSYLMVIPRSDPQYAAMESEMLRDLGFKALYQPPAPERYFVDVDMPADDAMASLSQKWRYNLRKSQKQDLRFEWHHGSAGAALFQPVFSQMMSRKNFYDESAIDSLEQIAESPTKALRPEFAIVFEKDEPVAAAAIDMSGERAIYLYGATNNRGNKLRAGYFMQWEIMKRLCKTPRIRWYDLGGATSETCSLHQFKRGLTGKAGVVSDIPPYFGKGPDLLQETFGKAALKSRLLKFQLQKHLHQFAPAFLK
ncbi:lipid II:glycine glycyltransferase FemX [Hoeflea poritis]|uniref:GNAT family N-acetyltransferase n=1 Tax=Hoeflea poritis TaxID=2993659 RepID=A0ABT4VRY6_9HYPH|nr:GNAT family N-acetyltransferase [Hoeflea poritis]MDA4847472.1 GNAT family N-acetyltransferase [Hoeflea poritis]